MSIFILKLLGIGRWFGDFVKNNWKWILPLLAVIGLYIYHKSEVKGAFNDGVMAERVRYENIAKEENAKNREFEKSLVDVVTKISANLAEKESVRTTKENTHTETIREIIKDNPNYQDCKVDQKIVDERNAIRRLGPGV